MLQEKREGGNSKFQLNNPTITLRKDQLLNYSKANGLDVSSSFDSEELYHKQPHSSSIPGVIWQSEQRSLSYSPAIPAVVSSGCAMPSLPCSSVIDADASSFVSTSFRPLKARASSYNHTKSYVKPAVTCREMGLLLMKELDAELVLEHPSLSETLFPSAAFKSLSIRNLKLSFDKTLLGKMKDVWSKSQNAWRFKAIYDSGTELQAAKWLNKIGDCFSQVTGIPVVRRWVASTYNTPMQGANPETPLQCKPDIVLMDVIDPNPSSQKRLLLGK